MGHIFISYSHKDSLYVHKLAEALKQEGFGVWIDDNIHYGSEWPKVVTRNLDVSDGVIVVLSNNSYESDMVQNEVTRAREKKKSIFPLLLDGENWLIVQTKQFVDVKDGSLPTEKFYKRLEEFTPRNKEKVEQVVDEKAELPRKQVMAIIAVAIILVVAIFVALRTQSKLSKLINQSPTSTIASTITLISPTNTLTPTITATPTPLPIEISDSNHVIMRLVPEGSFTMGSDSENDEGPIHIVSLNAFYIDKYEVSNSLYKLCVDESKCPPPKVVTYFGDEEYQNLPVVFVNWDMAKGYCEWRGAHLPTEAEWEKAARGENARIYPWGSQFDGSIVNFCDWNCNVGNPNINFNDGFSQLAPVDFFPEGISVYGLFNMAGNVAEWVSSLYKPYPYDFSDGREDLTVSGIRLLRGGAWNSNNLFVRTTSRMPREVNLDIEKDLQTSGIGFRCARDASP